VDLLLDLSERRSRRVERVARCDRGLELGRELRQRRARLDQLGGLVGAGAPGHDAEVAGLDEHEVAQALGVRREPADHDGRGVAVVEVGRGHAARRRHELHGPARVVGERHHRGLRRTGERADDAVGQRLALEQPDAGQHRELLVEAHPELVPGDAQHQLLESHTGVSASPEAP
jgi:hypothetical protein